MKAGPVNCQPRPLDSWGCFNGQIRLSDSPYIQSVWAGTAFRNATHLTAADGTIDFVVLTRQGATRLLLSGPTTKNRQAVITAGDEMTVIRLRPGVHLPFIAGTQLADLEQFLPGTGKRGFWLQSSRFPFPDFGNTETFVGRLARLGLLQRDVVIEDVLAKRPRSISARTVQRHALATTGMTTSHLLQIKRAEQARQLLTSGRSLTATAFEAGYTDTSHMSRAFKYFFGRTPGGLRRIMQNKPK